VVVKYSNWEHKYIEKIDQLDSGKCQNTLLDFTQFVGLVTNVVSGMLWFTDICGYVVSFVMGLSKQSSMLVKNWSNMFVHRPLIDN